MMIIMLLFIGILFITINIVKNANTCNGQQIIYRYIPRTFIEDQNEPVFVSDIFSSMFNQQSPWIRGMQDLDVAHQEKINNYFVSQS